MRRSGIVIRYLVGREAVRRGMLGLREWIARLGDSCRGSRMMMLRMRLRGRDGGRKRLRASNMSDSKR
jgi:hypothetical protein